MSAPAIIEFFGALWRAMSAGERFIAGLGAVFAMLFLLLVLSICADIRRHRRLERMAALAAGKLPTPKVPPME